jgi:DNA polymerase-3 subunit delta'
MSPTYQRHWLEQAQGLAQRPWTAALLTAPPGLGLGDFAVNLAAGLLCGSPQGAHRAEACGVCQSCQWVAQGQHPDLRWVRPAALEETPEEEGVSDEGAESKEKKLSKEIRIDQVRELSGFTQLSSHRGGVRIAVIGPVESLNVSSANALLKGLEEPAEGMRYLLYGERLQGVPATILSRCRRVALSAPAAAVTAARIAQPDGPQDWLLPLLAQGRLDAMGWADRAGKAPVRPVLEWLSLWLLDVHRMLSGLEPMTFAAQRSGLERHVNWVRTQPQPAQRLADAQSRLQSYLAHADHPLNPRLLYESVFISLQDAFPS